jgi:hypothetical protein
MWEGQNFFATEENTDTLSKPKGNKSQKKLFEINKNFVDVTLLC